MQYRCIGKVDSWRLIYIDPTADFNFLKTNQLTYLISYSRNRKMNNLKKMTAADERDMALSKLNSNLHALSITYKEGFLEMGKGGLLIYVQDLLNGKNPGKHLFRTKQELLELFSQPVSHHKLGNLINKYDPTTEGIMVLITSPANATYFVTCTL